MRRRLRAALSLSVLAIAAARPGLADVVDEGGCLAQGLRVTRPRGGGPMQIHYVLQKPCYANLRMALGNVEQTVITLVDHEFQESGPIDLTWDGRDASGNEVRARTSAFLKLEAPADRPPPDNCIYVKKRPNVRPDFRVRVINPIPGTTVSSPFTIEAIAEEGFRGMSDTLGYNFRWFLDDKKLLGQQANQDLPLSTLHVDPAKWPPGNHLIRVTYCDGHKHYGSGSVTVVKP